MKDRDAIGDIANSDGLSFRVGTWITLGGENDGDGETRFRVDCDGIEMALRAGLIDLSTHADSWRCAVAHKKDCCKIRVVRKKKHQGFSFGIAEAYIVLENFWP
jgi:hypothetical protein